MKIDLFNTKEFIEINKLKPITSAKLTQFGGIPYSDGLISNEIFGITTKSRRETFAYIDLHNHFFHPHIYKAIRRMFRNIDKIINGEMYYRIDSSGRLVEDEENGDTGLEFIYNNWEKINWTKNDEDNTDEFGMRNERINLLKKYKKDELFTQYQIVIPAFFRDIKTGSSSGAETDDINNLYGRLIRLSSLLDRQGMFGFQFNTTNYNIQNTMIAIYDYFKHKLEKKNGMIRKYLMGKNVDYCIRTVITSPTYHADTVDDLKISFEYTLVPLAQCCSLMYPFVVKWVKDFFDRNVIQHKNDMIFDNNGSKEIIKVIDPESYYSDKYIKKLIDGFMKDPESRFNKIEIPTNSKKPIYMKFTGRRMEGETNGELAIIDRPMTRTDLLYMACEDIAKNKHIQVTRYPINKSYGIFFSKIRVGSTAKTLPINISGRVYKWYPDIDINTPPHEVPTLFLDATQFSNSYLTGLNGDYDGDQTTEKILFTQEANEEIEKVIYSKKNYIDSKGGIIRDSGKETTQTFYVLTKDPFGDYRKLTDEEKKYFISLKKEDMTYTNFVKWFGKTTNTLNKKEVIPAKFNVCDTLTLTHEEYPLVPKGETIETTVGRLVYNKMMIESLGFDSFMSYDNNVMGKSGFKKFESKVAAALQNDVINTHQMMNYINTRDWFGLQFHTTITSSFTPNTTKIPPSVKALKEKLLKENQDAIAKGDVRVVEKIEKELISATMKELKDDIGMDLYTSGARGSVDNHLKNMYLMRGAVQNPYTKEYEIITNSLCDGLAKKDIATHSNVIVSGSFPKAVFHVSAAYKPRELLEHRKYTTISSEDLKIIK